MSAIDDCRFWLHDFTAPLRFTDAQIQEFLDLEKVNDSTGLHPAQTGWIPTYDVKKAAGQGWLWLAGCVGNTSAYTLGDQGVTYDMDYCMRQARNLLGSTSATVTRKDEPYYERGREVVYDGEDPRHRT